jgi:hypothetical protein
MPSFIGPWEIMIVLVAIIPFIFYLLALQRALERCSPQNRSMTPGLVWLLLIPLFAIVWQFFVVMALGRSLENEYRARGLRVTARPGQSIGIALGAVSCAMACVSALSFANVPISWLGSPLGIAGLVLWIVYWVRIHEYASRLVMRPLQTWQAPYQAAPPSYPPPSYPPPSYAPLTFGDFCTACGQASAGARYCPRCGQEQPPLQGRPAG